MMGDPNAAAMAGAAAEHARRHEEERLGGYTPDDLSGNWQFKIVRGSFGTRERIEALQEEQAAFGWTLVEVFDHQRVRFKRPAALAAKDFTRDGNPYATTSKVGGMLGGQAAVFAGIAAGFFVLAVGLIVVTRTTERRAEAIRVPPPVEVRTFGPGGQGPFGPQVERRVFVAPRTEAGGHDFEHHGR